MSQYKACEQASEMEFVWEEEMVGARLLGSNE